MQFRKKAAVCALVVLGLCGSAAMAGDDKDGKKDEEKRFTDPNKVIIVSKDHRSFKLRVKSNPTTGYSWVLIDDYNHELIEPKEQKFHHPDKDMPGAPGYQEWKFKVDSDAFEVPLLTHVTLQYIRPWVVARDSRKMTFTILTVDKKDDVMKGKDDKKDKKD